MHPPLWCAVRLYWWDWILQFSFLFSFFWIHSHRTEEFDSFYSTALISSAHFAIKVIFALYDGSLRVWDTQTTTLNPGYRLSFAARGCSGMLLFFFSFSQVINNIPKWVDDVGLFTRLYPDPHCMANQSFEGILCKAQARNRVNDVWLICRESISLAETAQLQIIWKMMIQQSKTFCGLVNKFMLIMFTITP